MAAGARRVDDEVNPQCKKFQPYTSLHSVIFVDIQVIRESLSAYAVTDRSTWVTDWCGQAVLCVSQKYWTAFVHESIRNGQAVRI